ncbi:eCIS core domain-containing protein [Wenjunlia tyrosinilytica]|uniref:L,D-TPase catalytic domain-containing protein n=1 Tax=Wenjunlia tyrosinilytica TaxID=1544741 RepID=A0A917ZVP4_9ACTN|nr:DUF4157 domain-containing protein [Wenjunlia tyrosinilytica]GGO94435.1 hypothetical protein GCM10012280_49270 [Wenjunlia tyrosinilytica]
MSRLSPHPVHQGPAAEPAVQRSSPQGRPVTRHPVLRLQESHGNQAVLRMLDGGQAQVIRRCATGDGKDDGSCACQGTSPHVQRQAAGGDAAPAGVPSSVHETLSAPGRPLDPATRATFEPRFGHDFGHVRVHTGAQAAASAKAVAARAYTSGSHIVFASGAYAPASADGRRLLAHELAHVVQQRGAASTSPTEVGKADDRAERSADEAARSVLDTGGPPDAGAVAPSAAPGSRVLRREEETEHGAEVMAADLDPSEVHDGDMPTSGPPAPELGETALLEPELRLETAPGEPPQSPPARKAPAPPPASARWITKIDIDLTSQEMTLTWSDGAAEGPRAISSGKGLPNTTEDPCKTQKEQNCTPTGSFVVGSKGGEGHKNQKGDAMAWYVEFVAGRGIGIHNSQPVIKGRPLSHGCVRVGASAADKEYAKRVNQNSRTGKTIIVVGGKAPTVPWTQPVKKQPAKRAAPKK